MKGKIVFWVTLVITVALAAVCGYVFCTRITIENAGLESLIPIYILLLVISIVFADLVHEGAHLLVGVCCRMGMKVPKIRPFSTSSVEVSPTGAKCMKFRMLITTLAGVFFNLLCVIVGILAAAVPQIPAMLCVLLPYSFYMLVINIAPLEYKSGKTDGLVAWELIRNKPTAQVMLAILKIQGLMNAGKPMKELDESMFFDVPQLQEDDVNFIILTQLRYEYYLDKGDDSQAYKYFLRYKDLIKYLPTGYIK